MTKTTTKWKHDMSLKASWNNNVLQSLTATEKIGPGPKSLLLSGLAGCSGIDVVDILEKMRVPFSDLVD